jgi:hypothetical protein
MGSRNAWQCAFAAHVAFELATKMLNGVAAVAVYVALTGVTG